MDKISKALELTRQSAESARRTRGSHDTENIRYTQTRSVDLDLQYLARQGIIEGLPDRSVIDAYKILRTRVMQRMRQNEWKTIGVTSAKKNEGKTITAINLAVSIAKKFDNTVVLVDADLRKPSIHKALGFEPELGLSDVLKYDTPVEDVLVNPGINSLVILPGREAMEGSSEYLASPKMARLATELRNRYASRYVIVDLPPVLVADDVVASSALLDTVLLVVEDERSSSIDLKKTMQLLDGVDIVGTVLNNSAESNEGDYKYY